MTFRPLVTQALPKRDVPVAVTSQPTPNLSVTTLLGQDALPCQSQNTFNPWGRVDVITNKVAQTGSNMGLLTVVAPTPKYQLDWPNPVLRKWSSVNLTHLQNTSPELEALTFTIPQGQQSFVNPYLPTVRRQDFNPPQPLSITTFVPPAVTTVHNTYFMADVGRMMAR